MSELVLLPVVKGEAYTRKLHPSHYDTRVLGLIDNGKKEKSEKKKRKDDEKDRGKPDSKLFQPSSPRPPLLLLLLLRSWTHVLIKGTV